MIKGPLLRNDWLLPSGKLVAVCTIKGERNPEVSLRYLDTDGVQSTMDFTMRLSFLIKNALRY
jgi:hypothetical protein